MREIKCKAFRKDFKEVGEVLSIDFENRRVKIEFYTKDNEFYIQNYELDDENIVIRWYTGLKDKNGVKIYEGDIVNCREYKCYGKIEWNEEEAGFYFYTLFEDGGYQEERLYDYVEELWVIGNIYENPELLEGRK